MEPQQISTSGLYYKTFWQLKLNHKSLIIGNGGSITAQRLIFLTTLGSHIAMAEWRVVGEFVNGKSELST
jgi:hypothetical protein